jgi:hypothetical protein
LFLALPTKHRRDEQEELNASSLAQRLATLNVDLEKGVTLPSEEKQQVSAKQLAPVSDIQAVSLLRAKAQQEKYNLNLLNEYGGNYNMVSGVHLFLIKLYTFLNGKYLFDILYNNYVISGGLKTGFTISKLLDKGFIELIGPFGLTEGSYLASHNLSKLDTGVITTYALYITLGLISILFILFSY